jgi:hypothetical protein
MVVTKKNNKLRICVDFRKPNATTKKNSYPLHFINEVLRNTMVGHGAYSRWVILIPPNIYNTKGQIQNLLHKKKS